MRSAASAWELIIQAQLGKLKLPIHAPQFIQEQPALNALLTLPIDLAHALYAPTLPMHHRRPFDRILIAQSQVEKLPMVTVDPLIAQHAVVTIW
jgi:PIN domain nuclease of toxin-antitoxin system